MHCGDFFMVHFAARLSAADGAPLSGSVQGFPGTCVRGVGGLLNFVLLTNGVCWACNCKNSVDSNDLMPSNMSAKVSAMSSWDNDDCNLLILACKPSWLNSMKLFFVH